MGHLKGKERRNINKTKKKWCERVRTKTEGEGEREKI